MITLNNFTKLDNNQYQMVLSMKKTDSVEDLPSETRPMSPEYFAVTVDYGTPADGSIVIKEGGDILSYFAGKWGEAGTAGDIKLKELSVEENGEYLPESGYVGFNKVVVDVKKKMPVKGDLIMLDGKQYRVLKMNDSVAEVLAMYDATDSQAFDASGKSNVYANSSLDVYLSQTFYNSLSTSMQNAIVEKTFQQDSWRGNGGDHAIANYIGTVRSGAQYQLSLYSITYSEPISRKCYAMSYQDIIDYLEVTTSMNSANTTLTSENILKMFLNQTEPLRPGRLDSRWARSADPNFHNTGRRIDLSTGNFGGAEVNVLYPIRPEFQIDLSKIDWTKSE